MKQCFIMLEMSARALSLSVLKQLNLSLCFVTLYGTYDLSFEIFDLKLIDLKSY